MGPRKIHGIKIFGRDIYFIYGPDNVARLRKYPRSITTPGATILVLKTLFGMTPKAVDMYSLDDSGIYAKPRAGSLVKTYNGIDYLTHASFHKHLLGEGLSAFYRGFAVSLMRRLPSLRIGDTWIHYADLLEFWLLPMTSALNEALAGPMLECLYPRFDAELVKYYPYLHSLLKGTPRWMIPEAYQLQKSLIKTVKAWHVLAKMRFCEKDIEEATGRDPWWGSAFIRERHSMLAQVDNWNDDAIASSDFGIFWGYVGSKCTLAQSLIVPSSDRALTSIPWPFGVLWKYSKTRNY